MAFDVHILHVRPNSTLKQRNIHLFRSERRLVTVLQIGRKLGQRVPAVLVCQRRVRCCRSRCRPMFVLTQSSNGLSPLANFRGIVLGRKEGRKEYRIILQKLKVPEVFSSDHCEKEREKNCKTDVGEKTCVKIWLHRSQISLK